jgi:DNA-nicking Smr family endonuclease
VKSFSELAALQSALKAQAEKRQAHAREVRRHAARRSSEAEVFRAAMRDITPLAPDGRVVHQSPPLPPIAQQRALDEAATLSASLSDEIDIERFLDVDETLSWRRTGIGPEVVRKLRRGGWAIKGQIDLHGLRTDEARDALAEFLAQARRNEWRCVRVIHGKGLGSVNRQPVLKEKVPRWLAQRDEVLAFCQARPNDGGAGAVIVLLNGAAAAG